MKRGGKRVYAHEKKKEAPTRGTEERGKKLAGVEKKRSNFVL